MTTRRAVFMPFVFGLFLSLLVWNVQVFTELMEIMDLEPLILPAISFGGLSFAIALYSLASVYETRKIKKTNKHLAQVTRSYQQFVPEEHL